MTGRRTLCLLALCLSLSPAGARDHRVRNAAALQAAVEAAAPGDRILLRPGTYRLDGSLHLEGKEDLVIEPLRPGGKVVLSGGVRIPRRMLRNSRDFPRGVKVVDLSRWAVTGVMQKGHERPTSPSWSEPSADGVPMRLAEWPDGRWMPLDSVVKTGISIRFDAPGSLAPELNAVRPSADVSLGASLADGGGAQSLGIIAFSDDRPLAWKDPALGWLSGCFRYGWADELVGIKAVGADKTIEVRDTTFYGFGFHPGETYQHWRVLNIPEEVTQPGEYSLDAAQKRLVLLPPAGCKRLELSLLGDPLVVVDHCRSVLIRGLEFSASRGDGAAISASEGVVLEACVLHNLGRLAVTIDAGCRDCGLRSCALYDLGAGAVRLDGGDRVRIERGDNFVEDCELHDYNRIDRSNRPAIRMGGLGNRISRCEISHSATIGIMLFGNDHLIEGCDIHDICLDVEDQGAIYNGRDPSSRGNVIRGNYFHDLLARRNIRAVYHDDGACACEVYGNVFNRISSAPVQIGGGSDIVYHDNLFMNLDCAAIKVDARLKTWGADRLKAHRILIAKVDGPAFRAHYPEFASYYEGDPAEPSRNVLERNVFYKVRWIFERVDWGSRDYNDICEGAANYFSRMRDNWKLDENPGFADPSDPRAGFTGKDGLPEGLSETLRKTLQELADR